MVLTRKLGERYLWVDALCIVQDDDENNADAIANMDAVYNHALLTIVAGSGTDANAGLPGVRPGTRTFRQSTAQVQRDLRVMAVGKGIEVLEKSVYSTRGWTYQEAMLSRRIIVFIDDEIYFQCRKTSWFEEVDMFDSHKEWRSPPSFGTPISIRDQGLVMGKPAKVGSVTMFAQVASDMSARQLTDPSDVLNAFHGLCNVLCNDINTTVFWGIPTAHFDLFILWNPVDSSLKRREGFPSWSWAGWYGGGVAWEHIEDSGLLGDNSKLELLRSDTWIKWYRREGIRGRPVYAPNERPYPEAVSYRKERGKISNLLQNKLDSITSPDFLGARGDHEPSAMALQLGNESLGEQFLHFWTVSVFFRLRREPPGIDRNRRSDDRLEKPVSNPLAQQSSAFVIDKHGQKVGFINFTSGTAWPDERLNGPPESPSSHELIALSGSFAPLEDSEDGALSSVDEWMAEAMKRSEAPDTEASELKGVMSFLRGLPKEVSSMITELAVYRVMLIEWEDGVAYRAWAFCTGPRWTMALWQSNGRKLCWGRDM